MCLRLWNISGVISLHKRPLTGPLLIVPDSGEREFHYSQSTSFSQGSFVFVTYPFRPSHRASFAIFVSSIATFTSPVSVRNLLYPRFVICVLFSLPEATFFFSFSTPLARLCLSLRARLSDYVTMSRLSSSRVTSNDIPSFLSHDSFSISFFTLSVSF